MAAFFVELTRRCPKANPSDLWQHVVYRHLMSLGWSDNTWKRVSGFALERALASIYTPRLEPYGMRMRILGAGEANTLLNGLGIHNIRSSKFDLFLEGKVTKQGGIFGKIPSWVVFGSAHVKSSIAERIQDDVPASLAFIERGLTSIAITMDSKSYPPPHGTGVNYGELGGRSMAHDGEQYVDDGKTTRIKRNYVERDGQFDALFSFNLRTPPSPATTASGKRIFTMKLHEEQPDALVQFLETKWASFAEANGLTRA